MNTLYKLSHATAWMLLSSACFASAEKIIIMPTAQSAVEVTIGAVYLQPGADNLGWAATTTVLPIPTPQWKIHTLQPHYQPGFTLGARYTWVSDATDLQFNWIHLRTSDSSNVSVDPATQWVSPFSQTGTPPTGGEITGVASLKTATGQVKFDYDVVNVDVGKHIDFGRIMQTRLFSGLSGVYINEQITSVFNGLPRVNFTLDNTSTYKGIGPRLGLSNVFHVNRNLNFVLQMAGSLLIGSMQPAQYEFVGNGSDLALVGIRNNAESVGSSSVTQVVPAVDAKIGINYLFNIRQETNLVFELGWMGALYINPLSSYETNTNVIALDSGSLSTSSVKHTTSNFSASGPYFIATINL